PAAPALIPLQVLDLIPSGIADTLLLPYTIYLQHSEGSLDL
ncbi:MAG: YceK/YidQ family lipoprotein, partial [Sphingobacteriales bacterium]